jgi:hypothetical protein
MNRRPSRFREPRAASASASLRALNDKGVEHTVKLKLNL